MEEKVGETVMEEKIGDTLMEEKVGATVMEEKIGDTVMEEKVGDTVIEKGDGDADAEKIEKENIVHVEDMNVEEVVEVNQTDCNSLGTNENPEPCTDPGESVQIKDENQEENLTKPDTDDCPKHSDNEVVQGAVTEDVEDVHMNDDAANTDQTPEQLRTTSSEPEQSNSDGSPAKNYKNVILEDWDFEMPQTSTAETSDSVSTEKVDVLNNNNNNNINNNSNGNNNNNDSSDNRNEGDDNAPDRDNTDRGENENKTEEDQISDGLEKKAKLSDEAKDSKDGAALQGTNGVLEEKTDSMEVKSNDPEKVLIKPVLDKKKNPLKYSNLIVSNQDIVEILDNSVERVCRPIIPAKDIFLSIELTKHLNQKLSSAAALKKNASDTSETKTVGNSNDSGSKILPDYQTKLVKTIEDLKTASKDKEQSHKDGENLSDKANAPENAKEEQTPGKDETKKGKRKTMKKNINIGDEMERTIALRQLRDEFPSTRKRSHTTKKVNHIPFLASSVLEKALTSTVNTPNKSGAQRRRPCYLPDNGTPGKEEAADTPASEKLRKKKGKEVNENDVNKTGEEETGGSTQKDVDVGALSNSSTPIVRTYSIKRKSTDSENEVISALQTFISATKEYQEQDEDTNESKPKKQKTVQRVETQKVGKTTPKKSSKTEGGSNKKRNLELEKLLGDEGAVRMLYETQHKDDNSRLSGKKARTKTTSGLKKDLMLKTKLVKNAVLRLSGTTSDGISLRGKRRSAKTEPELTPESDALFVTSTPNVILYKAKKKQRAEASKILYRHSSSESFESLEGFRRSSFEVEGLNSTNNNDEGGVVNGDLFKKKAESEEVDDLSGFSGGGKIPKKTRVLPRKRMKVLKKRKKTEDKSDKEKRSRDAAESPGTNHSKFQLSNVPVRKSCRPRMVSKKYSIWASTSMDSLSVESLGLKKSKKVSQEFAKKLNYKELRILQHGNLVQIILAPTSTVLKNSFNEQVLTELQETFEFLAEQESCNAVLLTSVGSTFCQGIDLNYVLSVGEDDRKHSFGNLLQCLKKLILCLSNFKKPIVAGVHSLAIGLGVTLLPYCDVVVCSDRASFYTPYARLGQLSEGAATVTFPRINRNLATELLYKSEKLSPSEAARLGLVSQVIPEDRFEEELMLLAKRIASQSSQAMQSMKLLINKLDLEKIADTLDVENRIVLEHWCSNECINNIIKFLNSGEVQFRRLDVP